MSAQVISTRRWGICDSGDDWAVAPVPAPEQREESPDALVEKLEALMRREVHRAGGFTMDRTGTLIREGLAVCADPATILMFRDEQWSPEAVVKWLRTHSERWRCGDVYLGGWHDTDSRCVYLELSFVFPPHLRAACLTVATANHRRAIFDLGARRVIRVPASVPDVAARTQATPGDLGARDLERHRKEYFTDGITLLDNLFPPATIARWREWALQHATLGLELNAVADKTWVFQQPGQRHAYQMIDGKTIAAHLPGMVEAYLGLIPVLSAITYQSVVASPYETSDVNVLVYHRPQAGIGWHNDTNPITVLLYLSDNSEGGTECRLLPTRPDQEEHRYRVVQPKAGTALLMQGRWVLHRGLPMDQEVKVAAPWNYYSTTDQWRPPEFDARIYGKRE